MDGMFYNCKALQTLDVSRFQTGNVTDMGSMFSNCASLTDLNISNFVIGDTTDTGSMIWGCDKMMTLTVPKLIIPSIYLPYDPANKYMWVDANGKECDTVAKRLTTPATYKRVIRVEKEKKEETEAKRAVLKKGTKFTYAKLYAKYIVTSDNENDPQVAYIGTTNKKLKTISIPEYVDYQDVKYRVTSVASKSFKNNKKLTTVKISSSITELGASTFEGCVNLKTATIGKGLKKVGKNAFKNCKKLQKLTIKSTKLKTVGSSALKNVNKKCKIKVPAKKVKAYKKLFKGKGQKASVKITK